MALFLLTLLLIFWCGPTTESMEPEFLTVPSSEFMSSLESTIGLVRTAKSTVNSLASSTIDHTYFGPSNGNDGSGCMDLVDLSYEVLVWSLSVTQNPKSEKFGTGDRRSDLKTWLSGVMALLDTCLDELDGDNVHIDDIVNMKDTLTKGISLAGDLLQKVHPSLGPAGSMVPEKKTRLPSWVKHKDKKLLQAISCWESGPDVVVVAKDGTGNFSTISEAVAAAPDCSMQRHVIFVKAGLYKEVVEINKNKWNIMMVGEGMDKTIVSWNKSVADGLKTFSTATFGVNGPSFIACNMSFENTAGPEMNQSVALRSNSDLSVFYRCGIDGYQDTLYPHSFRQFYRECRIRGTVDFIFGRAAAVFQDCTILVRKGRLLQTANTITANGRYDSDQSGFSFQSCYILEDSSLVPYLNSTSTYLGRPWKNLSRTVFMESYMSEIISPEGWLPWNGSANLGTLFYGEYRNHGPGARTTDRVNWTGYHIINDKSQANKFTVAQLIVGDLWLPSTGIVYKSGLDPDD